MSSALVTLSHSPLMGYTDPAMDTRKRVAAAFDDARNFISEFAPELVVLFGPGACCEMGWRARVRTAA